MISIIIPVYNEERTLPALLARLAELEGEHEVIFSDGGSTDGTLALLRGHQVVTGAKGRGAQCSRAAAHVHGDLMFFLHCDSAIERDALSRIRTAVEGGAAWGCLTLRFDDPSLLYRFGAVVSNLRVRWGHIAFGDQGIFMAKELFNEIGGFPDLPLMEDYELSLQLKRKGVFPVQVKSTITTSARRFREGGALRVGLTMQRLRAMYRRGVDMETIGKLYRDVREKHE